MNPEDFHTEVDDLLSECTLTEQDMTANVDLRKMKSLTAYADFFVSKTYQSTRELWRVPPMGGSARAQEVAQEVSFMVRLDETMHTLLHPAVTRRAGKL
jgi:hypothetical protein